MMSTYWGSLVRATSSKITRSKNLKFRYPQTRYSYVVFPARMVTLLDYSFLNSSSKDLESLNFCDRNLSVASHCEGRSSTLFTLLESLFPAVFTAPWDTSSLSNVSPICLDVTTRRILSSLGKALRSPSFKISLSMFALLRVNISFREDARRDRF